MLGTVLRGERLPIDGTGGDTRFRVMGFPIRFLVVVALVAAACERPPVPRANDTTVPAPPPPVVDTPVVAIESAWDTAAGPVFLVMGATADQAAVVVPTVDSAASLDTVALRVSRYRSQPFELFRDGRRIGVSTTGDPFALEVPEDCSAWPTMRVAVADSGSWSVALPADRFTALGIDTLAGIPAADSARLTRELARVASGVPGDTTDALRGLPFVVQRAWRATLPNGRQFVLAEIERTLNQEASPMHEHLVLAAERDSGATSRWGLTWSARTVGGEEATESVELLVLGVLRGREQPVALLARYLGDGVVYAMLARQVDGQWRVRWTSPYAGC